MRRYVDFMRIVWLMSLEPPWRVPLHQYHFQFFFMSWFLAISWLVVGALYAPPLIHSVGLASFPYQDILVISVAVAAGFVVQLVG